MDSTWKIRMMNERRSSIPEGFLSAAGLRRVLGCSRSAVYRLIQRLQRTVTVTAENGSTVEVLVVPELGGIKWPESDWLFERAAAERFRSRLLREARKMDGRKAARSVRA